MSGADLSPQHDIARTVNTTPSVARREQAMDAQKKELAELDGRIPGLGEDMARAGDAFARAKERRDRQQKLVDDGIEAIVSVLKVGDVCPICGNKIESLR